MKTIDLHSSVTRKTAKQAANFFVGDLLSTIVEAAVVADMDKFDKAVPVVSNTIKGVIRPPVRVFLKPIERVLDLTKNFEGTEAHQRRINKTEEERIEAITNGAYHYGAAFGVGYTSMLAVERTLSKMTHAAPVPLNIYRNDFLMHVGLVALMSMPGMGPVTEKAKGAIRYVSKTLGYNKQQSEDIARMGVISFIPNYTVFAFNVSRLYKHNKIQENLAALHQSLDEHYAAKAMS